MWFWFVCFINDVVWFFDDKMSIRSAIGTIMVLGGTFLYSLVRSREMDREKARKQAEAVSSLYDNSSSQDSKDSEGLPLLKKETV